MLDLYIIITKKHRLLYIGKYNVLRFENVYERCHDLEKGCVIKKEYDSDYQSVSQWSR